MVNNMKKIAALVLVVVFLFSPFVYLVPDVSAKDTPSQKSVSSNDGWVNTINGRQLEFIPELEEYCWIMERPPYEPHDKIALRELVKSGTKPIGTIFIFPGTWSSGEQLTSDDLYLTYLDSINADNDKRNELREKVKSRSIAHYLALRGWDVYTMDYRTHYVTDDYAPADLDFMKDWGWKMYVDDAKLAVDKAKEVSGEDKLFIGGESFGGILAMNYSAQYWQDDVKGIVLLDGGNGGKIEPMESVSNLMPDITVCSSLMGCCTPIYGSLPLGIPALGSIADVALFNVLPVTGMEMYALDLAMDMGPLTPILSQVFDLEEELSRSLGYPVGIYAYSTPHFPEVRKYAISHPLDTPIDPVTGQRLKPYNNPVTGEPIDSYLDWAAAQMYLVLMPGIFTNVYEGYNDSESLAYVVETFDRYWPLEVYIELIGDITRPGYNTDSGVWNRDYFNYYAHYDEIDVPLIAFISTGLGERLFGSFNPGIKNADATGYTLAEWGHLDVYVGTYNYTMVNEPTYKWLMDHLN